MELKPPDYIKTKLYRGYIINVNFKVEKIIQNKNYILYQGYNSFNKLEKFYSIKHNKKGYNGLIFKFILNTGKEEYVMGPWYDFSNPDRW